MWGCTNVITAFALLLLHGASAAAQVPGDIHGVIRDPSGANLAGVTVEVASPSLMEKALSVVTNGEGRYAFTNLMPGVYTVTVAAAGHDRKPRREVELKAGSSVTVDFDVRSGRPARFLAADVADGVITVFDEQDQNAWATNGWALDGTVRFTPWLGVTVGFVRSNPSDLSAMHYLVGPRVNTPFGCGSTTGALDFLCIRAFGHALVGAGNTGSTSGSEIVIGGGFDILLLRMQFDYAHSALEDADAFRAMVGGVIPLCFSRCGENDGFAIPSLSR